MRKLFILNVMKKKTINWICLNPIKSPSVALIKGLSSSLKTATSMSFGFICVLKTLAFCLFLKHFIQRLHLCQSNIYDNNSIKYVRDTYDRAWLIILENNFK